MTGETSCSYCYPACPSIEHPYDTYVFLKESGMLKTGSSTLKQSSSLMKCIEKDIVELTSKTSGAAKATLLQQVINEAMPAATAAFDTAVAAELGTVLEVADIAKIGAHTDDLISYYKSKDYKNIGWEIGAIAYDVTQALEGKSSVTIDGETFNLLEVNDQKLFQ